MNQENYSFTYRDQGSSSKQEDKSFKGLVANHSLT